MTPTFDAYYQAITTNLSKTRHLTYFGHSCFYISHNFFFKGTIPKKFLIVITQLQT